MPKSIKLSFKLTYRYVPMVYREFTTAEYKFIVSSILFSCESVYNETVRGVCKALKSQYIYYILEKQMCILCLLDLYTFYMPL